MKQVRACSDICFGNTLILCDLCLDDHALSIFSCCTGLGEWLSTWTAVLFAETIAYYFTSGASFHYMA